VAIILDIKYNINPTLFPIFLGFYLLKIIAITAGKILLKYLAALYKLIFNFV
jgi:hypothetical protein